MKLIEGADAPNFTYYDKDGKQHEFCDKYGIKVIFFFPKAFTPGCTKESCSIQSDYNELRDMGVTEVFGISLDSKNKLKKFAQKYNLEYNMVSDQKGIISRKYGVYKNRIFFKFADRDTFIINEKNKIVKILKNGLTGRRSKLGLNRHGEEIKNFIIDLESKMNHHTI